MKYPQQYRSIAVTLAILLCVACAKADLRYWRPAKDLEDVRLAGEILNGRSTGIDPILLTDSIHIDPETVQRITVEMNASSPGFAEFFWRSAATRGMSPVRAVRAPVAGSGEWEILHFDVGAHSEWGPEPIVELRFDPINAADAEFEIRAVSFAATMPVRLRAEPRRAPRRNRSPDTARRPNFLILLTDDQRWDTIGVNNPDLAIETPSIDRIANKGINFTNGFVTTPICAVSRAGIISGRYARNARIHCFLIPFPEEIFPTTYPAVLKEGGYFVGQLGKYGVGATREQQDFFDFFDGDLAQGEAFKDYHGEKLHDSEWLTRRTFDFLDEVPDGKPFALQVNYKAPHPSAAVAPEDEGKLAGVIFPRAETDTPEDAANLPREVRRGLGGIAYPSDFGTPGRRSRWIGNYLEKIISVDRSIGAILDELEERGLAANTVIIFLSDHGTHFGEKQLTGKWTPYEPSLKIPFIVYDPRAMETAGTVREELVLNIDIAPTLIDLAGLRLPDGVDGASLAPFLRGERPADWRQHFFFEHLTSPAMVPRPLPRNMGTRSETGKYLIWSDVDPPVEEFYDLVEDPIERFNIIETASARADRLRRLFDRWQNANPDNYDYMSYSHRPQSGAPVIDWQKLKSAHPGAYSRIKAEIERRGVTWEEALENRELRWEISVASEWFY